MHSLAHLACPTHFAVARVIKDGECAMSLRKDARGGLTNRRLECGIGLPVPKGLSQWFRIGKARSGKCLQLMGSKGHSARLTDAAAQRGDSVTLAAKLS